MKYLLSNSYSGRQARKRLSNHLSHYPERIITGLQAGFVVLVAWIFITLYLIVTN